MQKVHKQKHSRACLQQNLYGSMQTLLSPPAVSHLSLSKSIQNLHSETSTFKVETKKSFADSINLRNNESRFLYMDRISALEISLSNSVHAVSDRAAELVNKNVKSTNTANDDKLPRSSDIEICWSWITQSSRLAQMHVTYAAEYHKFHFEVAEMKSLLEAENSRVFSDLSEIDKRNKGSIPFECRRLSSCMKEHLSQFLMLHQRTESLLHRSRSVHPIHLRLPGSISQTSDQLVAVSLCKFTGPDGNVAMDEDVVIVDNHDRNVWRVKTHSGKEIDMPSICLAILGPDLEAVESVAKLKESIKSTWKRVVEGYNLHIFNLFNTFLEYVLDDRYTVESGRAEASLVTFLIELESDFVPRISDHDAAAIVEIMCQVRGKFQQFHGPDTGRRLSIGSVSSLPSVDPSIVQQSMNNEKIIATKRQRCLRDAEMAQQRILLRVLKEHVVALQQISTSASPAVIIYPCSQDATPVETHGHPVSSNVFVFPNQTDVEKISTMTSRKRFDSSSSSMTITSTNVANSEVQKLLSPSNARMTAATVPEETMSTSSAIVEQEPTVQVSTMHWMLDQPTKVEKDITMSQMYVAKPINVTLPTKNVSSTMNINLEDNAAHYVTKFETSLSQLSKEVQENGASWTNNQTSSLTQTPWDISIMKKTATAESQTPNMKKEVIDATSYVVRETGSALARTRPLNRVDTHIVCGIKQPGKSEHISTKPQPLSEIGAQYQIPYTSSFTRAECLEKGIPGVMRAKTAELRDSWAIVACEKKQASVKTKNTVTQKANSLSQTTSECRASSMHSMQQPLESVGASHGIIFRDSGGSFKIQQDSNLTSKSTQANFEIEIISRVHVRNHNLQSAQILSFQKGASDENALKSKEEDTQTKLHKLNLRNETVLASSFEA